MEPPAAPLDTTPDPAIVQPPGASPPVPPREQQPEQLRIGESGQFSEGLEDRGLLESSTRLKPHEAQSYRKKALWVSWVSIIVTLALAVAAFTYNLLLEVGVSSQERLLESDQMVSANSTYITRSDLYRNIAVSVMRYSASSFGFAFDATLDVLSSAIVLWRYSNAAAVHSAHREYITVLSGLFEDGSALSWMGYSFTINGILQRAIPIATSCRAMFAGKGIGHVCVAAGEMWGVHG
ncbi:hypothetical protein Q9233_008464 [Columba guinea]|nr:hypothetical protein Q9233_008464 [Columba guinea]